MARWWPFARVQHRAVSELALAAEQGRERNGRDRQGQTLVVTRWEDGTEVIFGMASMVVHVGKVDEDDEVDEVSRSSVRRWRAQGCRSASPALFP